MSFLTNQSNKTWLCGALLLYVLCFAANLGGAWFEYGPATLWNLLTTVIYLLFWAAFTKCARTSPRRTRVAYTIAVLSLVGSLSALLTHSGQVWLLMAPALFLAPLTAIPMYGLRYFLSWSGTYTFCSVLSGLWLIFLIWRKKTYPG